MGVKTGVVGSKVPQSKYKSKVNIVQKIYSEKTIL